jgi:hypothetical protein
MLSSSPAEQPKLLITLLCCCCSAAVAAAAAAAVAALQGNTQLWPHAGQYDSLQVVISDDVTDAGYSGRVLLKFAGLGSYMAAAANIVGAKLTVTFYNWDTGVTSTPLQVGSRLFKRPGQQHSVQLTYM